MKRAPFESSPPTQIRWLIVLLLMVLAMLGHFNRVSISVAGNERFIRDGLISEEGMGQVYTLFLIAYTVCMLPAGWIIDRFGPTKALTSMAAGMGACVVMTGCFGWQDLSSAGLWSPLLVVRGWPAQPVRRCTQARPDRSFCVSRRHREVGPMD